MLVAAAVAPARAADLQLSLDTRLVSSDAPTAYQDGGLGILRFGEDRSGLELGRLRLGLDQELGEILSFKLDASAWGGHARNPVDLTEAYFQLRPYPVHGWRVRARFGAFYAPVSLENRLEGWESPYTLSSSALDSWVAQELRTVGTELRVDWLGTHLGHDFEGGLVGAVYGWNQGAGSALTGSGFTITDWQGSLFGRVGRATGPTGTVNEYQRFDGRVGTYLGFDLHYLDRITLQALRYDNHANPDTEDQATDAYAWQTRFDTVGVRVEEDPGLTAIVQWMAGSTQIAPDDDGPLQWNFVTRFLLLSKRLGHQSLSARYDDFRVAGQQGIPFGNQSGHALTLAYRYEPDEHWRLTLEWVRARDGQTNRPLLSGDVPFATESQLQLAVRYAIDVRGLP